MFNDIWVAQVYDGANAMDSGGEKPPMLASINVGRRLLLTSTAVDNRLVIFTTIGCVMTYDF